MLSVAEIDICNTAQMPMPKAIDTT